ncbi:hypothetical protein HK102_011713, partial [Quaeritorhiza haematococci]
MEEEEEAEEEDVEDEEDVEGVDEEEKPQTSKVVKEGKKAKKQPASKQPTHTTASDSTTKSKTKSKETPAFEIPIKSFADLSKELSTSASSDATVDGKKKKKKGATKPNGSVLPTLDVEDDFGEGDADDGDEFERERRKKSLKFLVRSVSQSAAKYETLLQKRKATSGDIDIPYKDRYGRVIQPTPKPDPKPPQDEEEEEDLGFDESMNFDDDDEEEEEAVMDMMNGLDREDGGDGEDDEEEEEDDKEGEEYYATVQSLKRNRKTLRDEEIRSAKKQRIAEDREIAAMEDALPPVSASDASASEEDDEYDYGYDSSSEGNAKTKKKPQDTRKSVAKRAATYNILKNKGLTPHRKKEQRNPRLKKRKRYEKAMIKLKSFKRVAVDKGSAGPYG